MVRHCLLGVVIGLGGLLGGAGASGMDDDGGPPMFCDLTAKTICGHWPGSAGQPDLMVHGTRWYWNDRRFTQCELLQETRRAGRPYALFRCDTWAEGNRELERDMFVLMLLETDPDGTARLSLSRSDHLGCAVAVWGTETFAVLVDRFACTPDILHFSKPQDWLGK